MTTIRTAVSFEHHAISVQIVQDGRVVGEVPVKPDDARQFLFDFRESFRESVECLLSADRREAATPA